MLRLKDESGVYGFHFPMTLNNALCLCGSYDCT